MRTILFFCEASQVLPYAPWLLDVGCLSVCLVGVLYYYSTKIRTATPQYHFNFMSMPREERGTILIGLRLFFFRFAVSFGSCTVYRSASSEPIPQFLAIPLPFCMCLGYSDIRVEEKRLVEKQLIRFFFVFYGVIHLQMRMMHAKESSTDSAV